ncbi:MAG: tetratricopeptide repeat protein [Chitinivibrionales bacterium]|nr:tetratricopeptide repeat protein [Chitinivibrionales bacterium]
MLFPRFCSILLILSLVPLAGVRAGNLDSAWAEYRFQNWAPADELFERVIRDEQAAPDERYQARLGQLLIEQYRMPGNRPDKAIEGYRQLLNEVGPGHALTPLLHLQIARAYDQLDTPNHAAAFAHFDTLLQRYPRSPEAGEGVVDRARFMLRTPTAENIDTARRFLNEHLPMVQEHAVLPVVHQFCAALATIQGDYEAARDHYIALVDAGVPTEKDRATFLLQIARLSEVELGDLHTALAYYRRFTEEVISDIHLHFAASKAAEIEEKLR